MDQYLDALQPEGSDPDVGLTLRLHATTAGDDEERPRATAKQPVIAHEEELFNVEINVVTRVEQVQLDQGKGETGK
jgi:hypothetical protein